MNAISQDADRHGRPGGRAVAWSGEPGRNDSASNPDGPSAPEAMAAAIAKIADVETPSDLRDGAPRTTYTVGRASCEPPPAHTGVPTYQAWPAANDAAYQALVAAVTKAAAEGAAAENAFRGVKAGDLTSGAPATVRSVVTPF